MASRSDTNHSVQTMERAILVAMDYGTTFSGIMWAQTARPDVKTTIVQWPDSDGLLEARTSDKVPTEMIYDEDELRWGFMIKDDEARHQWFKLDLDPTHENEVSRLTINFPDPKALPPLYDGASGAVKLSTDYLSCLRQHTVNILKLKLGEGVVNSTPIRYIITVPAIWNDAAKARTQQCGIDAGMGLDIRIISEPEAAVVHALDVMDPHNLNVGDTFVLCDAGGGTVDLISYSVTRLEPKLEIREAVAGSGDACGSIFLNRIFRKYLVSQLEDVEGVGDDTVEDAMADFESSTKRKFTGEEKDVIIRVPGLADDAAKRIKRQKMTINTSVLKALFEPVIASITTLVKNQLKQTKMAKAVILVGGFGQSPYLRKCIEQIVGDAVEVLQPPHGWTAVVRGALIRALNEDVPGISRITLASRIARKAYGIRIASSFIGGAHESHRKFWNPFWGRYDVTTMKWFTEQGDEIDQEKPLVAHFLSTQLISGGPLNEHSVRLYSFSSRSNAKAPLYPCGDMSRLVKLTANLSSISTTLIPTKVGADGLPYYYLSFEIKVKFFSAHTEYSLWYKNKEYGKVNSEYA
ncbi:hypothetical protein LTR84_012582 [Exophiala bonariae]|uniref:Actin-like ATPase domain-containing protein n=1 Tax=Exophiala bonariae TaxID=1690606 RepID=A0AAV9NH09_9EURO|nr:hypothetical protein LTR84_012582 [Exophiala bonariae]